MGLRSWGEDEENMFQYIGTLGVTITLTCTLLLILPVQGREAVTGMNFWLHLITPVLTVVLFQCVETGVSFRRREMLRALIPYWGYMLVYFLMVVVGEENGGWEDIYYTRAFWPAWVSAILMFLLGLGEAALLRWVHDRRAKAARTRLTRAWREDLSPTELKIEAFGLGRYMAAHSDLSGVALPMDILGLMSERCGVPVYDLTRAYVKGACDELAARSPRKEDGGG